MATAHSRASRENANNPQSEAKLALPSRIGVGVIVFVKMVRYSWDSEKALMERTLGRFRAATPMMASHIWTARFERPLRKPVSPSPTCVLAPRLATPWMISGLSTPTHFVLAKHTGSNFIVKEPRKCQQWRWVRWNDLVTTFGESLFKPVKSLLASCGWLMVGVAVLSAFTSAV